MASITFAGTTLWDDTATGVGRVQDREATRSINWVIEKLPRNGGLIAKDNGDNPVSFVLAAKYWLTAAQRTTVASSFANVRRLLGAVNWPPGYTITNCILINATLERTGKQLFAPGQDFRYEYLATFQFQQLG